VMTAVYPLPTRSLMGRSLRKGAYRLLTAKSIDGDSVTKEPPDDVDYITPSKILSG
jgi:hypothetical protein